MSQAAPNIREDTASHLGEKTGVPTRQGLYAERASRSLLVHTSGHLPISAIGPDEVQLWPSQMAVDGSTHATIRAETSLLKTIRQAAAARGWLVDSVVERARLSGAVGQLDEEQAISRVEWATGQE